LLRPYWRAKHPSLSRAATQALTALAARGKLDDEQVTQTFVAYVRQRFQLALSEPTALEVDESLRAAGVSPPAQVAVLELMQQCAAARFAPAGSRPGVNLRERAAQVIRALETLP
jgi:hypothetical protein